MISCVCRNLISNAIKYSNIDSVITISNTEDENFVTVSVIDSGVGMSEKKVAEFFKIDKVESTLGTCKEKGSGLGLILSKEFVEANHGSFELKSELKKGTTVMFTLPKK